MTHKLNRKAHGAGDLFSVFVMFCFCDGLAMLGAGGILQGLAGWSLHRSSLRGISGDGK